MSDDDTPDAAGDPFDGLVLDEDFVRGAAQHEPSYRGRASVADRARRSRQGLALDRPLEPRRRRSRRTLWVTCAVIATAAAGAGVVGLLRSRPVDSHALKAAASSEASSTPTPTPSPSSSADTTLANQLYVRGACYTWAQRGGETTARAVSCSAPHLFQQVTAVTLPQATNGGRWPSRRQWLAIANRVCGPPVTRFLGFPLLPDGRWFYGIIHPLEPGWLLGDRTVQCGISATTPPGHRLGGNMMPTFRGTVIRAAQQQLWPAGTCLARTGALLPVPCSRPHLFLIVGAVTAPSTATPGSAAFASTAKTICTGVVARTPHPPTIGGVPAQVTYLIPTTMDWQAGQRELNCALGYAGSLGVWQLTSGPN
jgi:hypothetical protein